jgi:hypothetical protein
VLSWLLHLANKKVGKQGLRRGQSVRQLKLKKKWLEVQPGLLRSSETFNLVCARQKTAQFFGRSGPPGGESWFN